MKSISRTVLALSILLVIIASPGFCQVLRVNVMPGNQPGNIYPQAWPGRDMVVWGNVHDGTPPYTYVWDFGDGSAQASGAVSNAKYIAVNHIYATTGPKVAVLEVTDAASNTDRDTVVIEVAPRDASVEVNAAIEAGLRWQYLQQLADGRWQDNYGYPNTNTALAVLALENQGHLASNDINKDIYAEYVKQGLDWLTANLRTIAVPVQAAGNPEEIVPGNADVNGLGIYAYSGQPVYEIGMVMMAFVASRTPDAVAPNGPSGVVGRTYRDLMIDMVDYCAWAQTDPSGGIYRGGWRYGPNYGNSDNSVSQWPAIGLDAAESDWGISAPAFVKTELQYWVAASQVNGGYWDGAFYYVPGTIYSDAIPGTGAGICEMSYCDISQYDSRVQRSLNFLERMWNSGSNKGFYYAMYGVAKGCRIAVDNAANLSEITRIGSIDWYPNYAAYLVGIQNTSTGQWPNLNFGFLMDHSWALLILQKAIASPKPVAVISAPPSVPPSTPFLMDGSRSFHQDLNRRIVQWQWDFDASDGIDWSNPDATGSIVTNPGFALPDGVPEASFIVTLRVSDDDNPAKTDIEQHVVIVDRNNHPPTAVAGGPYAGRLGETITFDGTGSYDPDAGDNIASYSWDLDGDGVFGDCTDATCQRVWNSLYSGYVSLMVTDSYGAQSWDTSSVKVWTSIVDVGVANNDIIFSNPYPQPGDDIQIVVTVRCDALSDLVRDVQVQFYDGDPRIATHQIGNTQTIAVMNAGDAVPVAVDYLVPAELPRTIYVRVDPDNRIEEFNESNNLALTELESSPAVGSVYGLVTANSHGLAGVTVNLFQEDLLVKHAVTDAAGGYLIDSLGDGDYRVEVEPPLGFTPLSDPSAQVSIAGLPVEVNFELTNAATGKIHDIWWWKTQLQYIRDKKPSVISMANVNAFCQTIYKHFYLRDDGYAIQIENVTYAPGPEALDFYDVLNFMVTLAADNSYQACAARGLLTNLLNIAAGYQSQLALVSDDGATASQAITYFAWLYNIGGDAAYYSVHINTRRMHMGQMIPAGIIPLMTSNIMFKQEQKVVIPSDYSLSQNYPNPFNPVTTIELALPTASDWTIAIFNVSGQKVAEYSGHNEAGIVTVNWDASNLASGLYFYKANAGNFSATKKMVLLK